jgi:hypothetical protein
MLKKILYDKCPHCGSLPTLEKRTNGNIQTSDFSELMEFECGLKLFCKVDTEHVDVICMCIYSDEYKEQSRKRISALSNLFSFIRSMDIDDDFKQIVTSSINKRFLYDRGISNEV